MSPTTELTILHYNDVYNVDPRKAEPCGGAAKFAHKIKSFAQTDPLILFSGDAFSPSILSTFTRGEHMSNVLNEIGTHCAVYGNHDFDFGLEVLSERVKETNFPWLMSNVIDKETGRPLGEGKVSHVVHWSDKTIGIIGLVEREWLDTLAMINPEEVTFMDYAEVGDKLGAQLKQEGCDLVIALTHMRNPNDIKLAEKCTQIDIILGGHDHIYYVNQVNGKYIIKSGTDFRQFSKVAIKFSNDGFDVHVEEINVTSDTPDDPAMKQHLEKYSGVMDGKMSEELGQFSVDLDGRFEAIRTRETNLGNWVCDIILAATASDAAIINSGTFRSDRIHNQGPFSIEDMVTIIPMMDPLVVIQVSGETLLNALENAVSQWPKLEGRFAQVSGISFSFDPKKEPGSRVHRDVVKIGDEYLNPKSLYRVATKTYLASGCDGYTMFKNAKILVDEDGCPELGLAVRNHFEAIRMKQGKTRRCSRHRQSLVTLSRRHSLVKQLDSMDEGHGCHDSRMRAPIMTRRASVDELEYETCLLAPTVQGRITIADSEAYSELKSERERFEKSLVIQEVDEIESPK